MKLAVPLPALYGAVARVGMALEWSGPEAVGFGDKSVAGAPEDCGVVGAGGLSPVGLEPAG